MLTSHESSSVIHDRVLNTVPGAMTSEPKRDQALSSAHNQRAWNGSYGATVRI
jgi:hypothetical protein